VCGVRRDDFWRAELRKEPGDGFHQNCRAFSSVTPGPGDTVHQAATHKITATDKTKAGKPNRLILARVILLSSRSGSPHT
jgi:hypothetical protein